MVQSNGTVKIIGFNKFIINNNKNGGAFNSLEAYFVAPETIRDNV